MRSIHSWKTCPPCPSSPLSYLLFPSQAVAADDLPHLLLLFDFGETFHHVLQRRQVQLQLLRQMLVISADLDVRMFADHPVTGQELQREGKKLNTGLVAERRSKHVVLTSPISSFSRVDLPAPFGPTRATLVSKSIPNSRFLYMTGWTQYQETIKLIY